jgi:hypothetical protein
VLKRYDVVINGLATTLLLSDEDAKARGLTEKSAPVTKAATPENKARRPYNKRAAAVAEAFTPKGDAE